MKQITENVFIEDQYSVPPNYRGCNSGFVTTSEGIVMIDTPMMPTDAIKLRHTITKKGKIKYIINIHQRFVLICFQIKYYAYQSERNP